MCFENLIVAFNRPVYNLRRIVDLFDRVKFPIRLSPARKSTAFVALRDNFSLIKRHISNILFKHEAC